jgi:NAD(P)H dehydrogenase (quinone)
MENPMATRPRILVTGATGKTGGATAAALLRRTDVQTRVLVRSDDHRARALRDAGAEVIVGSMDDIRDMHRAMSDVQRAYFVAPITPRSLDHAMNFAIAAGEARLEHVVALGQWLSSASHGSALTRRTWLIDRLMTWIPGVDHTVINVGWFADNFMPLMGPIAQFGMLPMGLGDGKSPPISSEDIGAVAAGVLADPAPHAGRVLQPTGPRQLSPQQIADAFADVLGRPVRYVDAEPRMLAKSLRVNMPDPFTQVQVLRYLRDYRQGAFAVGGPTNVVEEVTGRPAEDFTSIVRRHVASDPLARRSVGNMLRVMANMARIMFATPLDVDGWQRENGLAVLPNPEDCLDAPDWTRTHTRTGAFSVAPPSAPTLVAQS